jgi:hypothetical protein
MKTNKSGYLLYETASDYDKWQKLVFIIVPAVTFVVGLVLLMKDMSDAATTAFAITVFLALLFHIIAPRKFQLYEDRLRVLLGKPFSFSISLNSIKNVRPASAGKAYVYWGVRWATSSNNVVEIERRKGLNMVISPSNSDTFVAQINDALKNYSSAE